MAYVRIDDADHLERAKPVLKQLQKRGVVKNLAERVDQEELRHVINGLLALLAVDDLPEEFERSLVHLGIDIVKYPDQADPESCLLRLEKSIQVWRTQNSDSAG